MKVRSWAFLCALFSPLALSGCEWIDDVGRHMPVVGERCENWQCFTEGGKAQSDANKRARALRDTDDGRTPLNGELNKAQPPAAEQVAPQAAAPQAPTPFDMTPEQLERLPTHSAEE